MDAEGPRRHAVSTRESEQHASIVRSLLDFVPEGITVAFGHDAVIHSVSRHGLELIQRSDAEVTSIGAEKHPQAWQVYELDGTTLVAADKLPLTRACRGEEVRGEQLLVRSSSGRIFPILCNAGPIKTDSGNVIGGVIAWRDITDVQALVEKAEKAADEAQRATRARDLLMSKISHDLRTPLGSVLGWLKIARARIDRRDELERALDVIERNTKTQVRLVDDLLDQNRVATGNLRIACERVNLAANVLWATEAMQPFAAERQVTLITDVGDGDLEVNGDATRLHQIFCNLLSNAVKFSPVGSEVRTIVRRQEYDAVVEVIDKGAGLSTEHLDNVFEPFWQAPDEVNRSAGLGLGLSIVKHLVAAHGGSVSVSSGGLGKGALFRVVIPLYSEAAEGAAGSNR